MITKDDLRFYREPHRVLEKGEDYMYLLPHPALRDWISNYTVTFPGSDMISNHYTVIPHGCATLVCSCDETGMSSRLFGPATAACSVGEQANQAEMLFIIEFQPAGLYAFTGVPQKELTDRLFSPADLSFGLDKWIIENIDKARSVYEMIGNIDSLLLANVKASLSPQLHFSVHNIIQNMGSLSVKELSDTVYYSQRHLNRMFVCCVGMNTKTFSRLVRINSAVRLLHNPQNSITNACNLSGFYDLPHFIHDFKSVCGISPQEYRREMSDFYSEIAKF
ncbi:helix-turn-helix domain-containing protein [Anaerostipes caccae]|uniref:helix-turn-helix domain-containing protein n=1 Tax=Anaerostipes caccae TaxID=105841 RepID=UPI00101E1275|nr:AraC family transcriptional regulator [Anaerostipes caccae]